MSYAKEKFNTSVAVLSLAWVIKNKNVSTMLLGATKEHQLEENLKALPLATKLTAENMKEIEEIVKSKPAAVSAWGRTLKNITGAY